MKYIFEKLKKNETVYIHYDFEDVVVRLVPTGKNKYKSIAKFKGGEESEYPKNSDLIHETEMRGEIITKEQYELYGHNEEEIVKKFKNNETVYLLYDIEDVVMKLIPIDRGYKCIAKFKGADEHEVDRTSDLAVEFELGGKIITKEQCDLYGLTEEDIAVKSSKTKQKDPIILAPHFTKEELDEMRTDGMGRAIIELQLGRKPKNKEEVELLKEIRDAEAKGYTIHLPLD